MATTYQSNIYSATTLDCVNDIISCIGEPSVTTLDSSNVDVVNALRILDRENRKLQMRGWTFNIQLNQRLVPDTYSKLISWVPAYITVLEPNKRTNYINRDGYVYDRVNETNQFTAPIVVNIIRMQELDSIPDCFLQLIVARSCRLFNNQYFGASEIDGMWQAQEQEALIRCNEYEMDFGHYNMFTDDAYIQFQQYR